MLLQFDSYSRHLRPTLLGARAGISSAHPLATAAAQLQIANGGSAADAVVAAQAVLSVIAPESCGLGGDAFFLIKSPGNVPTAINAAGRSSRHALARDVDDDGTSVTVPGLIAG